MNNNNNNRNQDLKREFQQLRQRLSEYDLIFNSMPIFFWYKDTKNKILRVNESAAKLMGMEASSVEGKQTEEVYPAELAAQYYADDLEVINSGIPKRDIIEPHITSDGHEKIWLNTNKIPVRDAEGNINGVIAFAIDVTEQYQLQATIKESKTMLDNVLNTIPVRVFWKDLDGIFLGCNDLFAKDAGKNNVKEIIGQTDYDMGWSEQAEIYRADDKYVTSTGKSKINYEEPQDKEGKLTWLTTSKVPLKNDDGDIYGVLGTYDDITERKETEGELLKLKRAVESSSSVVIITDYDGHIEYVNPKFTEVTGYGKNEILGKKPSILQSEQSSQNAYEKMWNTITIGNEWKGEFLNQRKDGSLYWARNSISAVKNNEGEITHFISIHEDITREYELSKKLSYQAAHDNLTGLINRHEFERRVERLLSTTKLDDTEHALCFMDLDQFKVVNDTCGHTAGDDLLRQLSSLLKNTVRQRDTLARLGGDEFAVLMEHCSLEQAKRVAKLLLNTIQDFQFSWENRSFKIGVSIGLVSISDKTRSLTQLLRDADVACYMAKDLGRNRIHIYHAEDKEIEKRHGEMQWVTRINQALDENRFCLYAQPIISLKNSSHNNHYELLIRMIEDDKIIPPGAFLPAAERYTLISKIDHWVIRHVLGLIEKSPKYQSNIECVSINISGASLTNPEILDFIVSNMSKSEIAGEKLCFEITETAAISNLSKAKKFISTLKGLGCKFSLDDFGSGLSSFAYLKNLPVDYLKIDGMFVKDILHDEIDHAMVKSINEIGHIMGMQTIAEFVENDDIKKMLEKINVDYVQGYGIGEPRPFNEFLEK